jgi:hypothetical protein
MRFVNTNRSTKATDVISGLSDTINFIAGGVAKGNAIDSFSWVAEFLFKYPKNTKINPHIAYISFFSDKEIMYEEFGNVERITENYSFFNTVIRQVLPENSFELTRKQYTSVSNNKADFDLIEYLNVSDQIKFNHTDNDSYEIGGVWESKDYNHGYWRAPAFIANGYREHLDGIMNGFDKYYWSGQNTDSVIELKRGSVFLSPFGEDLPTESAAEITAIIPTAFIEDNSLIKRMIDVKFNIANPKYFYFDLNNEWVCYYNDTKHYYDQSYSPYYGIVNYYNNDWKRIPYRSIPLQYYNKTIFFPAIIRNNILEPAKIISQWVQPQNGQMTFNNGVHLGKPEDQSRIVYNICKHMIDNTGAVGKKVGSEYLYSGIDVDTERNRRYSAVVMTEPYFVTEPICGGEIVSYMFVDRWNNPIKSFSADNPDMFLKIKAGKNIIQEIDNLLSMKDYNTDIIETVSINDPVSKQNSFSSVTDNYYKTFTNIITRQEDYCDDLVGKNFVKGIVGIGNHTVFTVSGDSRYSDSLRKINGLGFISKTNIDSSGNITGTSNILNLYCSNYSPIDSGNPPSSISFVDSSLINSTYANEQFKPMLKLPGINGYIKIIEKNNHFKITRARDGLYEVIYNVEFPFCPGSYSERLAMNFTDYKETCVLKKLSYINAGSQIIGDTVHHTIDGNNDRYVPFADDSFTAHTVLSQYDGSGSVSTNSFKIGGGLSGLVSSRENIINYPSDMVWTTEQFNLLSLLKPRETNYRTYGTYDLHLSDNLKDRKLFCLSDNRQWKYADDNYISYIGNENPSYVCEIDVSTLFKNFTDYQALNAALPDVKRWLYAYFSGFANTMLDADTSIDDRNSGDEYKPVTEKVSTMYNNDLSTGDTKSGIVIETWDKQLSNWRPLSVGSYDSQCVPGKSIINGVHISDDPDDPTDGLLYITNLTQNEVSYDLYTAIIGYVDENGVFKFPDSVNYGTDKDILSGKSNLVLLNNLNNKTYHIIYIEPFSGTTEGFRQLYKAWIFYDPTNTLPVLNPEDFNTGDSGPLSIYEPIKQISKDVSFELYTSQAVQGIVDNIITRFIDIKSVSGSGDQTEYERYINDNKLYFRIRVIKNKNYQVSYENLGESMIQYVGDSIKANTLPKKQWSNFPWTSDGGSHFDTIFDWKKIETKEIIRKFGMSYFKCASR